MWAWLLLGAILLAGYWFVSKPAGPSKPVTLQPLVVTSTNSLAGSRPNLPAKVHMRAHSRTTRLSISHLLSLVLLA